MSEINELVKRFEHDTIEFKLTICPFKISIKVCKSIWAYMFDQMPEHFIANTNYNRQTLKNFKFKGIDTSKQQLLFSSRLRIMKFTKKPYPLSGTWKTYDNAWDVDAGLNIVVNNNTITGKIDIHNAVSDWPSGLIGIIESLINVFGGSFSWLFTGEFQTLSDIISKFAVSLFNASDLGNIDKYLKTINDHNKANLLIMDSINYEANGIWFHFVPNQSEINSRIEEMERKLIGEIQNIIN